LRAALSNGPVVVKVNSSDKMFKNHKKGNGIISNQKAQRKCGTKTDHAVLRSD
jgi:hypothetical protein